MCHIKDFFNRVHLLLCDVPEGKEGKSTTCESCHAKLDDDDDVMPSFSNRKSDGSSQSCQKKCIASLFLEACLTHEYLLAWKLDSLINDPIKSFTTQNCLFNF